MGNLCTPVKNCVRRTAEYAEAKMLFAEKRQAKARVAEIDRELRCLRDKTPEAVDAARIENPCRRPCGLNRPGFEHRAS
jgi:hypothetical protein